MQVIYLSEDRFQYDIHSLFKAFYPMDNVRMIVGKPGDNKEKEKDISDNDEISFIYFDIKECEGGSCGTISLKTSEELMDSVDFFDRDKTTQGASHSTNGIAQELDNSKNALKKLIYKVLGKKTGKELPWGNLTGIRPTRIAMNIVDKGGSDDEIRKYMKDMYFVSDEKIDLSIKIARREKEILKDIDYVNGYSLYIGIPFCPTTCLYCSFTSYPIGAYKNIVGDYIACLKKEIDYVADNFADKTLDTIYIGGGTPTTLLPDQIDELLGYVHQKLDTSRVKEFTVESGRPDSITREKLQAMKRQGCDRISVNPQTMRDETLKLIGRQHNVAQLIESFHMAREEGFDNINMDIILGLPGETSDDVRYTMQEIAKLNPDDLTVHSLAIKRGSRLAEILKEKEIRGFSAKGDVASFNNTEEMMKIAANGAAQMGLEPYYLYMQKNISGNFENTGYARKGKAGIYNILINEEVQSIVALGAGTVTKRVYGYDGRIERCDNVKDVKLYMEQIDEMINRKRELFNDK